MRGRTGRELGGDIAPLTYKMLRSGDFEALVGRAVDDSPDVRRVEADVRTVEAVPGGAVVHGVDAHGTPVAVRARWVFDSRPLPALPAARTTLLQHFHGWFVRAERPAFDPSAVEFMDLRVPQPARGLAFGYVLPLSAHEALVEYTRFSRAVLTRAEYEEELRHWTGAVLGLGAFRITGTETGVIPMTDARFARRAGASVFRIGTAGGATRPATGYTFSAVQRQSDAIVRALRAGRVPEPPPAHSARARVMDAVLLRALDSGRLDGAAFFERLFARVPTPRLLRFLDGRTTAAEDVALGLRTPVLPMLRTVAELPRLPRVPHLTGPPGAPDARPDPRPEP